MVFMDGWWMDGYAAFFVLFLCSMIPLFVVLFVPRIHTESVAHVALSCLLVALLDALFRCTRRW